MIDYMLKFESKQQAEEMLVQIGAMQLIDEHLAPTSAHAVDIIGEIYKPDGTFNEAEGMRFPNYTAVDGYHVNVRTNTNYDQQLADYIVTPATPYRVWA